MKIEKWQIYKLKTNAVKDVWTKEDLKAGYITDPNLVGKTKYRNTIFIKTLADLKDNDKLLLIAQTNSNNPNEHQYEEWKKKGRKLSTFPEWKKIPYINVKNKVVSNGKHKIEGFISPINVRFGLASEFNNKTTRAYGKQGHVVSTLQNEYFENAFIPLLKYNGRLALLKLAEQGAFNSLSKDKLSELISIDQFNIHELSSKFGKTLSDSYKLDNTPILCLSPILFHKIRADAIALIPANQKKKLLRFANPDNSLFDPEPDSPKTGLNTAIGSNSSNDDEPSD